MGGFQSLELYKKWSIFGEVCIPPSDATEKRRERLTRVLSSI
jgi:hypothetical protein